MSEHTTDEIKCPYCGHKFSDSWEYCNSHNEQIVTCTNDKLDKNGDSVCEKDFALNIDYTTHYYTTEIKN